MSTFSRRHFNAIAETLKECHVEIGVNPANAGHEWGVQHVIMELCKLFIDDNRDFQPRKFLEACGITGAEQDDCYTQLMTWAVTK